MQKGLEEGVFLYPGGTGKYRDIICIGPAFSIEEDEVDLIVNVVKDTIEYVTSRN